MSSSRKLPSWLETAVFYQIYPQSYYDSNGDGIGDLPGITAKLDYIASVGFNAIWLNPCFESPFMDAGYDVSDYCKVASRYGTNEDLRVLCAEAKKRGIRVLLDLVPGHTSNQHPWFKASAQAEPNEYSDYYIWTKTVWQPVPQGMDFVSGYSERYGKYITNFFWFQPALNYGFAEPDPAHPWQLPVTHPTCQKVRAEMRNIMKFWLDLGASGFRVDMAGSLVKGNGPKRDEAMRQLWGEVRDWLEQDYPEAVLISEWGMPTAALGCHFHMDFILPFMANTGIRALFYDNKSCNWDDPRHELCFFDKSGAGDSVPFVRKYEEFLDQTKGMGYICVPSGNHDTAPRLGEGRSLEEQKCLMTFVLTLPGAPFLYYGDEIGMRHVADLVSKEGGYNRTAARTPMQWDDTVPNAGFSTASAEKLYLPLDNQPGRPTVAGNEADRDSLLHFLRNIIALRKKHRALAGDGNFRSLYSQPKQYPLVYLRSHPDEAPRIIIALNPREEPATVTFETDFAPTSTPQTLLAAAGTTLISKGRKFTVSLGGAGYGIWAVD